MACPPFFFCVNCQSFSYHKENENDGSITIRDEAIVPASRRDGRKIGSFGTGE